MAEQPLPPEQDITPFMKFIGAVMLVAAIIGGFALVLVLITSTRAIDKLVVATVSILPLALLFASLVILRPGWMKWLLETVATILPGWLVKFDKNAASKQ